MNQYPQHPQVVPVVATKTNVLGTVRFWLGVGGLTGGRAVSARAVSAVLLALALLGCTSNTTVTRETGAGSCLAADAVCDADADECCNGSTCASKRGSGLPATCHANCLSNAQCASGCCVALATGESAICVEASDCAAPACGRGGADCSTDVKSCCATAVCVSTTTDPGTCADTCRAHTDCKSGCCAPLTNSPALVCSPPSFCR